VSRIISVKNMLMNLYGRNRHEKRQRRCRIFAVPGISTYCESKGANRISGWKTAVSGLCRIRSKAGRLSDPSSYGSKAAISENYGQDSRKTCDRKVYSIVDSMRRVSYSARNPYLCSFNFSLFPKRYRARESGRLSNITYRRKVTINLTEDCLSSGYFRRNVSGSTINGKNGPSKLCGKEERRRKSIIERVDSCAMNKQKHYRFHSRSVYSC